MKPIRWLGCFFFLGTLLLLVTSPVLAWPKDAPDKATISGPGLKGEVEITDQRILSLLGLGMIEDFEAGALPAPQVGEGYQITRYFYDASFDFGRLHYYPGLAGE